jgi:ABC-type transport system involved in multi-copper enzyme maturation permease subunit
MRGPLGRLVRLLSVERQKAFGGKTLRFGVLAVLAVSGLAAWAHDGTTEETGWTVASSVLVAGLWAAEIFLLVAGTTAIAGESAQGTLKMILPHAYRRSDWILAKGIALAGQALLLLLVAVGAALLAGHFSGGLGDVTQTIDAAFGGEKRVEVLHSAGEMRGFFLGSSLVAGASLTATALLGLLLSCLFDGVVPALSAGFLVFLGVKSAGALFGASQAVLERVWSWYPSEMLLRVEKLSRGFSERWNETLLPRGLTLAAIVAGASLLVSLVVFGRRDLRS